MKTCRIEVEGDCTDWQDTKPAKGGAVSAPPDKDVSDDDFYRQLHNSFASTRTTPEPQTSTSQAPAVLQQPVASPPASKGDCAAC